MKKLLLTLLAGFVLHMLYMDLILIKQTADLNNCFKATNKFEFFMCVQSAQNVPAKFYGKDLGLYQLIPWNNLGKVPWRFE
jgi:hypothetical protein